MKLDDIIKLEFGEQVILKGALGDDIIGVVRGIDTWSVSVRVEFGEDMCIWCPPRVIRRVENKDNE
jgi:hypothetical protein